jgi:peptidoglycan/xylan/chitin deacetylase (PgdA/CDA1 family)
MYHWLRPKGVPSSSRSPQLEITPELFGRQMAMLSRAGYRPVPLGRAVRAGGDEAPPRRSIVITFDDGTLDFWEHAKPILARHGFTATLFVVTGQVGGHSAWDRELGEPDRPLMSWDQIRQLHRAGFEIGSHTHTHRPLTELTEAEVRSELDRSRRTLADELGAVPQFLAYPRGFYTDRHKRLAREAGYAGACAVILRWRDLWRSDPYALKRMSVKGDESMFRFRMRLALCRLVRYASGDAPAETRHAAWGRPEQ